jgi:hypothetical protein
MFAEKHHGRRHMYRLKIILNRFRKYGDSIGSELGPLAGSFDDDELFGSITSENINYAKEYHSVSYVGQIKFKFTI